MGGVGMTQSRARALCATGRLPGSSVPVALFVVMSRQSILDTLEVYVWETSVLRDGLDTLWLVLLVEVSFDLPGLSPRCPVACAFDGVRAVIVSVQKDAK